MADREKEITSCRPSRPVRLGFFFSAIFLFSSTIARVAGAEKMRFEATRPDKTPIKDGRVCLVPVPDQEKPPLCFPLETEFPCPAGQFRIRVEASGLVIPHSSWRIVNGCSGTETPGEKAKVFQQELEPAGVARGHASLLKPGVTLQLLHTTKGEEEFLSGDRPNEWVSLPVGEFIALGTENGKGIFLTRPTGLSQAKDVLVGASPSRPTDGKAAVWLSLRFPMFDTTEEAGEAKLAYELVSTDGKKFHPDLAITHGSFRPRRDRLVFYDLPPGRYTLRAESPRLQLKQPLTLEVRSGEIFVKTWIEVEFKPKLSLRLDFPSPFHPKGPATVALRSCPEPDPSQASLEDWERCTKVLDEKKVSPGENDLGFGPVSSGDYAFIFHLGPWNLSKRVHLTENQTVEWSLRPAVMHGFVRRGETAVRGSIEIILNRKGDHDEVLSDAESGYRLPIWEAGYFGFGVREESDDASRTPFRDFFEVGTADFEKDFDLPANRIDVLIRDTVTHEVPADLKASCYWEAPGEKGISSAGEALAVGADGRAVLPRLRSSRVTVSANAKGYKPGMLSLEVGPGTREETHTIDLERKDAGPTFNVTLPDGSPGSGALWCLGITPDGMSCVDAGACSQEGKCELRREPQVYEPLFLAHPQAGLTAILSASVADQTFALRSSSGALRLKVETDAGAPVSPSTPALRLSGLLVPLNFVVHAHEQKAGSLPFADAAGRILLLGAPDGDAEVSARSALGIAPFVRLNLPSGEELLVRVPSK